MHEYNVQDYEPPLTSEKLLEMLSGLNIAHETVYHPPLFTVEDSQKLRGDIEGGHTKNLFLKDKKGQFFLLTAEEDSTIHLKTLHKLLGGSSRFSFGSAEMMEELLGVKPGAVTALGVVNDVDCKVKFAIDQRLLRHEKINCHPLTNEATTTLKVDDLLDLVKKWGHEPQIVDLAETV